MTFQRVARWVTLGLAAVGAWLALSAPAQAVPVFARQTGHNCEACHTSPPELTAYGREFKLNGYTFGEAQLFPVAVGVMASVESVGDNVNHADGTKVCPNCNEVHIDQASLYFGGKITENLGVFGQYTVAPNGGGTGPWSGAEDNTEVRYVHRFSMTGTGEDDTVVGIMTNNNLSMQDAWNNAPAWQFPGWFANSQSGFGPVAATYLDNGVVGGQRQVGVGAYIWWKKTIYAELSEYQKPWGAFSWLVNGSGNNQCGPGQANGPGASGANGQTVVNGACAPSDVPAGHNPYLRLAYSKDWDYSSLEVGLMAISAKTYFDAAYWAPLAAEQAMFGAGAPAANSTSSYRDFSLDAQYQYNRNEPWIYTIAGRYTHESMELGPQANTSVGAASNVSDTLNFFTVRGTAYYQRKYGASLSYSNLTGSSDMLRYGAGGAGGSATGNPASSYWDLELDYVPLPNMKFLAHYTAYTKLNGGSGNFDGLGNNASGQNTLVLGIWWDY